jgi:hypothetical protein
MEFWPGHKTAQKPVVSEARARPQKKLFTQTSGKFSESFEVVI